jgi:predicted NUDIX family phosphoesterase
MEDVYCFDLKSTDYEPAAIKRFDTIGNAVESLGNTYTIRSRDDAEGMFCDDNFERHLIVYCILINKDYKILSYERTKKSGEQRLVGKKSIGIGGHVNPIYTSLYDSVVSSMYKELYEEIYIGLPSYNESVFLDGKINPKFTDWRIKDVFVITDSSSNVNKVHVGIVPIIQIGSLTNVESKEENNTDMRFIEIPEIIKNFKSYETWSQNIIKKNLVDIFL